MYVCMYVYMYVCMNLFPLFFSEAETDQGPVNMSKIKDFLCIEYDIWKDVLSICHKFCINFSVSTFH